MRQMPRCPRCQQSISSSDMVMRAREHVYHVSCFTCSTCHISLNKGDQFGMCGVHIFCREHHQVSSVSCIRESEVKMREIRLRESGKEEEKYIKKRDRLKDKLILFEYKKIFNFIMTSSSKNHGVFLFLLGYWVL